MIPEPLEGVETAISTGYVGGAFKQRIEGVHPLYRLIECAANFRAKRLRIFYGDGGIFMRRTHFNQIGGFPDIPIMEEVRLSRKLRRCGKVTLMSNRGFTFPHGAGKRMASSGRP